MDLKQEILGYWSADACYGPGAQSDEAIVFLPDGTGVIEVWNFRLCGYETFRWSIEAGNTLVLTGIIDVTEEDGGIVEEPSTFGLCAAVSISRETTPSGKENDVLRVAMPPGLPDMYCRVPGRGDGYQIPAF